MQPHGPHLYRNKTTSRIQVPTSRIRVLWEYIVDTKTERTPRIVRRCTAPKMPRALVLMTDTAPTSAPIRIIPARPSNLPASAAPLVSLSLSSLFFSPSRLRVTGLLPGPAACQWSRLLQCFARVTFRVLVLEYVTLPSTSDFSQDLPGSSCCHRFVSHVATRRLAESDSDSVGGRRTP